ncbi:unnamed protein product [Spirodela intermedia]|uniref:Uncharacterized protein n=1 Tax=Spirodela intermedia TaxID=51605 RepID=A0A7I8IL33_SPIIN|nr:unnamed protein product [Spirodela intermedia]CAA6658113.1 unnamed protein product [Spirodela intermedia]
MRRATPTCFCHAARGKSFIITFQSSHPLVPLVIFLK